MFRVRNKVMKSVRNRVSVRVMNGNRVRNRVRVRIRRIGFRRNRIRRNGAEPLL